MRRRLYYISTMTQKQDPHVSNNYKYNIFTLKKQIKKPYLSTGYGVAREFSRAKPINSTSWTYLVQVHGITRLIGTFGRTPVVLQLAV